ncbi:hypothetical protein KC19_3G094000 [Ceratodon purpureus]|uniref:Enhanced disease resistance 4-like N-terminal domain-containing protein n=1 Tax=Ceratodon purpureus TaxID=3225 RepID=A0A8T0IIQ8_CERPU|nr:hypothetical protein KC19_3G094000 [Ceratodon purpureus]
MATMDRPSRIVRCPKCLALLQEPPPGTPLYKCGNCSTVLRAKHASADASRRSSARVQQQNRATPPGHADSIDSRRLPSKPMPPDHTSRQTALGDPDDQINRSGNSRPTPVDTGRKLPTQAHHSSFPSGPSPPLQVPHSSNTNDDNGLRPGRDHHRLSPRDSLAAHGSGDEDSRRGREGPTSMPQTKASSPAHIEEVQASNKLPNYVLHKLPSPPVDQIRNPAAKYDTTGGKEGIADMRTRNMPINASANTRQKSPPVDPAAEAPRYRRPPTDLPILGSTSREKERQWKSEDNDDQTPFSPTKALAALHLQNAGPLYKVKERQTPGLGLSSQGTFMRGRNKSQGDEYIGTRNPDSMFERNLDGRRRDAVEAGPSTGRSREEKLGVHRRQRSDGVAISGWSVGNDRNPALPAVARGSVEDDAKELSKFPKEPISRHPALENEKRILPLVEATADKMKSRDDPLSARVEVIQEQKSIARASSSDVARRLNEISSVSPPKANTPEPVLSPTSDSTSVRRRQQKEPDMKVRYKGKPVVDKGSFDDEEEPRSLSDNEEVSPSQSPQTTRKSLSPPRNMLSPPSFIPSKSAFGGVQPQLEQSSKAQTDSRQDLDAPSNLQNFPGLPDVLDYDTSDDSSNVDDADSSYQIVSKPHSEELKSPTFSRNGQGVQGDTIDGNNERSDDEAEQDPADRKSPNSRSKDQLEVIGSFGPVKSVASPHFSPHRSPDSIHGVSPSQAQVSDQRKQELQEDFTQESDTLELNSFSFGLGGDGRGSAYSLLKGQTQKVRLQINTPVPERIHVRCRHCSLQLEVPLNLPRSETGVQKLRCGSCWKISRFRLNHLLSPSRSPSPGGSDNSPESSFRLGSNSSDGTSGRYSGTRSNRETGSQDRVVLRTQSGANLPVPPSARHNPRAASGSKLANMVSGSSLPSETSKASTPNTSGDLGPVGSSSQGGKENLDILTSPSGQAEPPHASLSPALSSTSQDISTKDRQQKTSPDRKLLQSSSDSEEEKPTAQLKIGPTGFNPARMTAWSAPETPEFDDGHEFKGLKGFLKKSVKELTKGKKSTQYRRKVVVNGHAVPDDVVKRAEEFAGAIHPGTYWYDFRAGFWGVMGGPCLGMIPPFIEELNFPLARHCSHGKTGVLVNGRELHHKDLELLKKRGLPGTPGKAYNVDIDGRLTEETTGIELKGLGRLAPTLEQTGRGPGMWVPESQRGS